MRYPSVQGKSRGLIGALRKRSPAEHLQGTEVHIGDTLLELAAADFGKESVSVRLTTNERLESTLKWNIDVDPDVSLRLGIWTGALLVLHCNPQIPFRFSKVIIALNLWVNLHLS
jgi:hypothetical protein